MKARTYPWITGLAILFICHLACTPHQYPQKEKKFYSTPSSSTSDTATGK